MLTTSRNTRLALVAAAAAAASTVSAAYTTTWQVNNLPDTSENGQRGTNRCGSTNSQTSECQNVYVNSIDDFCLWAPPEPNSAIGDTEEIEVAWCTKDGHGTRTIPEGALTGVHFVQTPDYVQITGQGRLSLMNINSVGGGGELDPHGATGLGNPIGGLVFSDAFGSMQQIHEWTNFMSEDEFCIRACKPGPNAWLYCNHIYDVMGCAWNMPANYDDGVFETCEGDSDIPMGLYSANGNSWGSTFQQGQPSTPAAHAAAPSSQCQSRADLGIGATAKANSGAGSTSSSSSASRATSSSKSASASSSSSSPSAASSSSVAPTTTSSTSTSSSKASTRTITSTISRATSTSSAFVTSVSSSSSSSSSSVSTSTKSAGVKVVNNANSSSSASSSSSSSQSGAASRMTTGFISAVAAVAGLAFALMA